MKVNQFKKIKILVERPLRKSPIAYLIIKISAVTRILLLARQYTIKLAFKLKCLLNTDCG